MIPELGVVGFHEAYPHESSGATSGIRRPVLMPSSAKREEIERVMLDPCSLLPDPIGKAGFAVPDIRSFAWHPLGDPTHDNWIVASPEVDPKAGRSFRITEKSRNNIFVLGDQCKVVGNNFVDGSNNLSILIGVKYGVHPVHLQLKSDNHVFFGVKAVHRTVIHSSSLKSQVILLSESTACSPMMSWSVRTMSTVLWI